MALLAHFVYSGKIENRVEAVTRIVDNEPNGLGSGLVATSPNACQAMCMDGNITFTSDKGSAFSNSNKVGSGSGNPCHSMAAHGNVNMHMDYFDPDASGDGVNLDLFK